jgi:eukaryotic-like serine/threonine-protein kinase
MKSEHMALAVLAFIGVLAIIEAVLGNIVASLLQGILGDHAWLIVVPFIVIAAVLLAFKLGNRSQARRQDRRLALDRRNRQDMLAKVRAIWITDTLQRSLVHEILIDLDLEERAAAVIRPLDLLMQRPDHADRRLPPGTRIVEMFDELGRALLILGVPGVGKTTRLLELARDLLDRAVQDSAHRIPVVFKLSSWAIQQRPLEAWLVEALREQYDISRAIGQAWVEADAILPLLDGLDEVESKYRTACVEAINTFRKDHGLVPLVVCSRTADYEALGTPLRLQGALVVQPLTHAQVDAYLIQVGAPLAAVRQAVQDDPTLWELLDTPLMLAVVTAACAGEGGVTLHMQGTLAERRQHLFTIYVDRMFRRGRAITAYTRQQTEHWLTWLAVQMTQHGQTVFYLERMQPTWLPYRLRLKQMNFRYRTAQYACLLVGILAIPVAAPLVGLVAAPPVVLVIGLAAGAGVFIGAGRSLKEVRNEMLLRAAAMTGVTVDAGRSVEEIAKEIQRRATAGGQAPSVVMQEVMQWWRASEEIISVETLRWSWSAFDPRQWRILLFIVIPLFGLVDGLVIWRIGGFTPALFGGVATILFWGLVLIPDGALASNEIETKTVPNEGIRRSARNALFMGLTGGMVGGIAGGLLAILSYRLGFQPMIGVLSVLGFVLSFGLAAAMRYGGYTWLQHRRLRRLLVRHGAIPRHYVEFLDYAAERIFLRKVGGYIFIHPLLQNHFAARYKE